MNKPALLVMDIQNGIVSRLQDNMEMLRAVQETRLSHKFLDLVV